MAADHTSWAGTLVVCYGEQAMLRTLVVLCVLHSGCGRFGFADRPDAARGPDAFVCTPVGHDEDGDGVDDACDVCPHLVGTQADGDGDRVGDACDPEPTNPRQRIALFDPFEVLGPPWSAFGGAVTTGGKLRLGTPTEPRYVTLPHVRGTDSFIVGGSTGAGGAGSRLIAITLGSSTPARFYCELVDDSASTELQFTYTLDGSAYMFGDETPAPTQMMNGAGTLHMSTSRDLATCSSTWHGESLTAVGTIPAVSVETLLLYAQNIDASLDYFLQIHTDD